LLADKDDLIAELRRQLRDADEKFNNYRREKESIIKEKDYDIKNKEREIKDLLRRLAEFEGKF